MARQIRKHATRLSQVHESALDTEFGVGQRVLTIDGRPGRILFVASSYSPGLMEYEVVLDNGMGQGTYLGSQLRPIPADYRAGGTVPPGLLPAGVTAALEAEAGEIHLASDDYPEMGDVLRDRPDPGKHFEVVGSRRTGSRGTQGDLRGHLRDDHDWGDVWDGYPDALLREAHDAEHEDYARAGRDPHDRGDDWMEGPDASGGYLARLRRTAGDSLQGRKEHWEPGERAHFEYHCDESPESQDYNTYLRSHEPVTVLRHFRNDAWDGSTINERAEEGVPDTYDVRHDDGYEHSVFEDELLTHPQWYFRPDPPRPHSASVTYGRPDDARDENYNGGEGDLGMYWQEPGQQDWVRENLGPQEEAPPTVPPVLARLAQIEEAARFFGTPVPERAAPPVPGTLHRASVPSRQGRTCHDGAWYHATPEDFRTGDLIEPGHPAHYQDSPEEHVYFTDHPRRAEYWAGDIAEMADRPTGVYEVEPTGPHESDPYSEDLWDGTGEDYRSRHPLRVIREATTINGTPIDGHGDAPEHGTVPRAADPDRYDARSTEGDGDPAWSGDSDPDKRDKNSATVGMYPEGISAAGGPGLSIGPVVARVPWTGEERSELHGWQDVPTATWGDFVPSGSFTHNKSHVEETDVPAEEVTAAELQAQGMARTAASAEHWAEHLRDDHGHTDESLARILARGERLDDFHAAIHDAGMASHAPHDEPPVQDPLPVSRQKEILLDVRREQRENRRRRDEFEQRNWPQGKPLPPGASRWRDMAGGHYQETDYPRLIGTEEARPKDPSRWTDREQRIFYSSLDGGPRAYTAAIAAEALAESVAHLDRSKADEVFSQLAEDYPRESLDWVHNAAWSGPHLVPLDDIDWDGRHTWNSYHQADRISSFEAKARKEWKKGKELKPVIMVQRPGMKDQMIVDGHHRSLTQLILSSEGKRPDKRQGVWAWTAHVTHATGPWDELHAKQFHDDSKEAGGTGYVAGNAGSSPAQNRAFQQRVEQALAGVHGEHAHDADDNSLDRGAPVSKKAETEKDAASLDRGKPKARGRKPDHEQPGAQLRDASRDSAEDWPLAGAKVTSGGSAYTQGRKPFKASLDAFTAAAGDPAFRFEFTAAWKDVVAKAKRIRTAGRVRITHASAGMVIGQVGGDHDVYESGIQRPPGRPQTIQFWACGCPWASFHQDKSLGTRYAGRPCSHVMALQFEALSRYMRDDRQVTADPSLQEMGLPPAQVVVKSLPPWTNGGWAKTWLAPSASLRRTAVYAPEPEGLNGLRNHLEHHHGISPESFLGADEDRMTQWHDDAHSEDEDGEAGRVLHQHDRREGSPGESRWPSLYEPEQDFYVDEYGGVPVDQSIQEGMFEPGRLRGFMPRKPHMGSRPGGVSCLYAHEGPCPPLDDLSRTAESLRHSRPRDYRSEITENPLHNPEGYRAEHTASHVLTGYLGNKVAGRLHFSRSDDGRAAEVHMLHSRVKGQGIASAMMDDLYEDVKRRGGWLDHGSRLPDGHKWWASYREPYPEINTHHAHPDEGWAQYWDPMRVAGDAGANFAESEGRGAHTPLSYRPEDYPFDDRDEMWTRARFLEPPAAEHTAALLAAGEDRSEVSDLCVLAGWEPGYGLAKQPYIPHPPAEDLFAHLHYHHSIPQTWESGDYPSGSVEEAAEMARSRWPDLADRHARVHEEDPEGFSHQHTDPQGAPGEARWPDTFRIPWRTNADAEGGMAGDREDQLSALDADPYPHPAPYEHLSHLLIEADQANGAWGDDNVVNHPPQKPYGATSPPNPDQDPGSYGFLAGPDPANWGSIDEGSFIQMPLSNTSASLADAAAPHLQGTHSEAPGSAIPDQENQEDYAYSDRGNTAGPFTALDPRDQTGMRMDAALSPEEAAAEFRRHMVLRHGREPWDGMEYDAAMHMRDHSDIAHMRSAGIPLPEGYQEHEYEILPHERRMGTGIDPQIGLHEQDWLRGLGIEAELHDHPEPALPSATGDELETTASADETIGGTDAGVSGPDAWGAASQALMNSYGSTQMADQGVEEGISGQAIIPSPVTQMPGPGSHDEYLTPQDSSIQTIGQQQWSGEGIDDGPGAVPAGQPQGSLEDIVASFQRSAGARQYSEGGQGAAGGDVAAAAREFLSKTADVLPQAEADELIREGSGSRARNLDLLRLEGTHYADEDEALERRGLDLDDYDDDVITI